MHRCLRLVAAAIVALFCLAPVLGHPGWPYNHDGLRFLLRIAEIGGQWRAGHPIPIWSNVAQHDLGSPGPALYHKLFSYVGAALVPVLRDPKAVVCATLFLFMVLGFLGMAAALRAAAARRHLPIECLCGTVAITSNYAFTDWLIRGAVAEFAAFCLLPWFFAWGFRWLRAGVPSRWIGPLMWLLWLAHSAIATFSWIFLLPCAAIAAIVQRRRVTSAFRPMTAAVLWFAVLLAPFVAAAIPMMRWAQVSNLVAFLNPTNTHQPFIRIFRDTAWQWGGIYTRFTLQLDPVLIGVLFLLPAALLVPGRQRAPAALCLIPALLTLLLQLRLAVPFFRVVPGFEYIQFSWRLLTFLTVSLSVGLGVLLLTLEAGLRNKFPRTWRPTMAAVLCAILLAHLPERPRAPGADQPWFGPGVLRIAATGVAPNPMSAEPPEYLPRGLSDTGDPHDHARIGIASGLCELAPTVGPAVEVGKLHFRLGCPSGREVAVRQFLAPGMRMLDAEGRVVPVHRTCDDARIRIIGESLDLTLIMPTIGRALKDWWRDGGAYRSCTP
ncbi:hypothetical protein [Rhizosaccharibacter radicis]|uniref:Glycosyltransferase RgtA/B/C/D-like domain-containing protein n=1 Tax=Rhizosaccharibacter radicis TaxID=2782605 RepID=A0ABT1VU90_9PROT|nr:hypothetical protein [Acetobacteraceae bacterium KSS12]